MQTSQNPYVAPYSYLGVLDASADVATYGQVVSAMCYSGGAVYPASISPYNTNTVNIVSGKEGNHDVYVTCAKQITILN